MGFARWLLGSVALACLASACSSSSSSGNASDGDASTPANDATAGGGGACKVASGPPPAPPAWKPPLVQRRCSTSQILGFFEACVGDEASTLKCNAFRATSAQQADCASCLLTDESAPAYGPLVEYKTLGIRELNLGGCLAIATHDTTGGSCGQALEANGACERSACAACAVHDEVSYQDYNQCVLDARGGACKGAADAAKCLAAYAPVPDASSDAPLDGPIDAAPPPPVDAGADAAGDAGGPPSIDPATCAASSNLGVAFPAIAAAFCGGLPEIDGGVTDGGDQ